MSFDPLCGVPKISVEIAYGEESAKMRRFVVYYMLIAALFAACVPQTGSEGFGAPEIVEAEAAVAGVREAVLRCTLSEPRAERCGFAYGEAGGQLRSVECRMAGSSFELRLETLTPGATYEWYAFAAAGESEVRSKTARFTLEPLPREELAEIADPVFKAYLTEHFDADQDGEISVLEALDVRKIAVKTDRISSLEGIEYFKNLDTLICRGVEPDASEYDYSGSPGHLRSLDLSSLVYLRHLECDGNYLETLVLPDSPWLEFLRCSRNKLKELDLSKSPGLRLLQAFVNNLPGIDFSANTDIESIEIGDNRDVKSVDVTMCPRLATLNLGYLSQVKELNLSGNPRLGWLGIYGSGITSVDLNSNPELRYLNCENTPIASLDLSPCTKLYELKCWDCLMEELDISMLPYLEVVECAPMASLRKLYVSDTQRINGVTVNRSEANVPAGAEIVIRYAGAPDGKIIFEDPNFKAYLLSSFDFDKDGEISLEEAAQVRMIDFCSNELNVSSLQGIEFMPGLEILRCQGDWVGTNVLSREHYYLSKYYHWDNYVGPIGTLKKVDVSHNPKLRILDLDHNSGIGETGSGTLDLSNNPELEELCLTMCYVNYPSVSDCPKLRILGLSHGRGEIPTLSSNAALRFVDLSFPQDGMVHRIDVSNCPLLEELDVNNCASSLSDLSLNQKLKVLRMGWCRDLSVDISALVSLETLECTSSGLPRLDISGLNRLQSLECADNPLGTLDLRGQPGLKRLVCNNCRLASLDVSELKELEYLDCGWNSLSSFDLSGNPMLNEVYMAGNPLGKIDVSSNYRLYKLYCAYTGISELDVSHNPLLWDLRCDHNELTHLDVSANPRLWGLYCEYNHIDELDLSGNRDLQEMDCTSNKLEALDISHNPLLRWLVCGRNMIRTLDVSQNPRLTGPNGDDITGLYCAPMDDDEGSNVLDTLWVKAGQKIEGVTISRSTEHVPAGTLIKTK